MTIASGASLQLDPAPESQLVEACKHGNKAAADALVDMHWERVFSFSYGLTRNKSDADDLTQEAFLRAFKNIGTFNTSGSFRSWLFRIASNVFLDEKKSSRAKRQRSMENEDIPAPRKSGDESVGLIHKELVEAINAEIELLSDEQRTVMNLRIQGEMDYHQISEILGMQEVTVRWHMHQIRAKLRQKLIKRFDMEDISI